MEKVKVHVVYFPFGEQLYSKGMNVEGKTFSEAVKNFEKMQIGTVFNVTLKEDERN